MRKIGMDKVLVSRSDVARFNETWPTSPLDSGRHYWFKFDHTWSLEDTDVPEHQDGSAAVAMANDCEAWLVYGELPSWGHEHECVDGKEAD